MGGSTMVKKLIHLEGFVTFISTIILYAHFGGSWWIFILFLLAPDISVLAYLVNEKFGSIIYNLFHTYAISVPILLGGFFLEYNLLTIIGIIWTTHIGMDRMVGYGLKYPTAFKDTHLQKI